MPWKVEPTESRDVHVYPLDDLKEHETESRLCPCRPKVEQCGENFVVIHNSWDGRELAERARDYIAEQGRN